MKDSPGNWLASAISVLGQRSKSDGGPPNSTFKLLSSHTYQDATGRPMEVLRILSKETGAVWEFTCKEERPPV